MKGQITSAGLFDILKVLRITVADRYNTTSVLYPVVVNSRVHDHCDPSKDYLKGKIPYMFIS